jgi:hypothetical protein
MIIWCDDIEIWGKQFGNMMMMKFWSVHQIMKLMKEKVLSWKLIVLNVNLSNIRLW